LFVFFSVSDVPDVSGLGILSCPSVFSHAYKFIF
jgi:hypothetical protein